MFGAVEAIVPQHGGSGGTVVSHAWLTFIVFGYRVLHEPFGEAFYFGPQRMSSRFTPEKRPQDFAKYCDLSFRQVSQLCF